MNLHQRIAKAMEKVTYVQKDKKQGMRYSVVSHDVVTAKVRPALLEAGVIYYPVDVKHEQVGNRTQCAMTLCFANIDEPSDNILVQSFGYGIDEQDKGPGKAMSYAVKYALLKTLGLETGDDPDMDQDVKFSSPALNNVADFIAHIKTAKDITQLETLLEEFRDDIDEAAKIDKARVNMARQAYAKKKKELSDAG